MKINYFLQLHKIVCMTIIIIIVIVVVIIIIIIIIIILYCNIICYNCTSYNDNI